MPEDTDISSFVVELYERVTEVAPGSLSTEMNEEFVVCLLQGVLSRRDLLLIEEGHVKKVREHRELLAKTIEPQLIAGVERITGRRVIARLTDMDYRADVCAELFLFDGAA
jgi:uncharacterized protein YbcI